MHFFIDCNLFGFIKYFLNKPDWIIQINGIIFFPSRVEKIFCNKLILRENMEFINKENEVNTKLLLVEHC